MDGLDELVNAAVGLSVTSNTPIGGSANSGTESEPKFKYNRIGGGSNDLDTALNAHVFTCCAVHSKFLAFGTSLGHILLLDHEGNLIKSSIDLEENANEHTVAVNCIDVDVKGEYLASCSDDGRVNITGLFSSEWNQSLLLNRPIKSVRIDPEPKNSTARRFVVGGEKLMLYERVFMKKLKGTELCGGDGYVLAICWRSQFIAWASSIGVRIYDLNEKCSLGYMRWETPECARLENYRCNFHWLSDNTLLIGWANTVRVCVIRKRSTHETVASNLPGYIVDPFSTFQTTFYISGIAPLSTNQLIALGCPRHRDGNHQLLRPVLCVLEYKANSGGELSTDSLALQGYLEYSVNDYQLGYIDGEQRYYIITPKDIVVAALYDVDDRVQWLVEHQRYEEAMDLITNHGSNVSMLFVAKIYINQLLNVGKFDEAAKMCLRALGKERSLWEEMIIKFYKYHQLRALSSYLPTSEDSRLLPQTYEMVLFEFLKYDVKGFLTLIKEWPPHIYDTSAVIKAISENFRKANASELLEAIAILYSHNEQYELAVYTYLKLKNTEVFALIRRYMLHDIVPKVIIQLMELDKQCTLNLLLDEPRIPTKTILRKLEPKEKYLYWYLDALQAVDESSVGFHTRLVGLYAKYEREKLLPFLRQSSHYSISEAMEICKRDNFFPELVYLLAEMGNSAEALTIIMYKIKDVDMAIEFCKEHNDPEVWNQFIGESLRQPELITKLLDGIRGYVAPEKVIQKLKSGQRIPHLRDSLVKLLWDYRLEVQKLKIINSMENSHYFECHSEVTRNQRKGRCIDYQQKCEKCKFALLPRDTSRNRFIAFNCGHAYHELCVPIRHSSKYCAVCKADSSDGGSDLSVIDV